MADKKETKVRRVKVDNDKNPITKTNPVTTRKRGSEGRSKKVVKAKPIKKTANKRKFSAPRWLAVIGKPFFPLGRYIRGSWQELRMTKWPNRRSTWSLTIAVLLFAVFFAVLILLVDYGYEWLMKEVIL